jgi:hypothetical protein
VIRSSWLTLVHILMRTSPEYVGSQALAWHCTSLPSGCTIIDRSQNVAGSLGRPSEVKNDSASLVILTASYFCATSAFDTSGDALPAPWGSRRS